MPPKKVASRWGNDERAAVLHGFEELKWNPFEESGPAINKLLKSLPKEHLDMIKPHFSASDGGTKTNNNTLYGHFKKIGCEFIVARTRAGVRRKDGASLLFLFVMVNLRDLN